MTVASEGRIRETVTFPDGSAVASTPESGARITAGFTFGGETYTFGLFDKESRSGVIPFEDTDQMLLELHGLILALHHDARFLRTPGALDRARAGVERVLSHYRTATVPAGRVRALQDAAPRPPIEPSPHHPSAQE